MRFMATAALQKIEAGPPSSSDLFKSAGKRRFVFSLLLVLLTLLVYNPALKNGFVNFDDPAYVTGNRHIQSGLTWSTVRWAFGSTESANWHPLTWLSHALDYQLFHLKAAGHHYDSVVLHALSAVLLFLFLDAVTGQVARSLVVAALFAVHPINVESVAWISERKNVLCTIFFFAGLSAYAWYAKKPGLKRYSMVVVSFVLGLMSKPMVITFPCLLLVMDYWPLRRFSFTSTDQRSAEEPEYTPRSFAQLLLEKVPLFLLSAASAVITVIAQKSGGALRDQYALSLRIANALVSYVEYLKDFFWPSHLAAIYPFPRTGLPGWKIALCALVLALITIAVLKLRHKPYLAAGWFWFLGTLVPVIGLVQVGEQAMADRYAYIPYVGLFIAVVWGVADWAKSHRISGSYVAAAALLWVVGLSFTTRAQTRYWESGITLWTHALDVTQQNFVAEDNMGAELLKTADVQAARSHFQAAAEINPQDAFSQLDIGVCDKRLGNLDGAIEHYLAALGLSAEPTLRTTAFSNLGSVYRVTKRYDLARQNYLAALQIEPDNFTSLLGLALIEQRSSNLAKAVDFYARAAVARPSNISYLLLAQALEKAGRKAEAEQALTRARQAPGDFDSAGKEMNRLLSE